MDWWYWFGMWIAGVSSVILTFWLTLDASRRRGSIGRFSWPLIALTGVVLQIPAFTISGAAQAAGAGTAAAAAGIAGLTLVGVSAIAYFSKGSGSGNTWFTRTRDNDSLLSGARGRRAGSSSARASVPLGNRVPRTTRTPTPVDFSEDHPGAPRTATPLTGQNAATAGAVGLSSALPVGMPEDTDKTIAVSEDPHAPVAPSLHPAATAGGPLSGVGLAAGEAATIIVESDDPASANVASAAQPNEVAQTIHADFETETTVTDEPTFATIMEEPDGFGGRLVITDGRSSRIMITERTGPFIVGRDPKHSNLAVDDPKVSRAHLSISRVEDEYVISDLDSSNGTFVNGEMLRDARVLQDGDTIEFGRTMSRFVIDGEPANA